ncbi:MAG: glutamate synthase domain-containing protein 2 [Planctomycetota bacterium]|jgi:glutamate synthase domain-containing protein 2
MLEYLARWEIWAIIVGIVFILILGHDLTQTKKSILRNFPVLGHLRYLLIEIGPELRQYVVASNREEAPFNRSEREWIDRSADKKNNYFGFGTDDQIYGIGYPIIKHAVFPYGDEAFTGSHSDKTASIPCAKVLGEWHGRSNPYRPPSIINISAMSFGSLGAHAIQALNEGAFQADCYHNTGEGGVSPYHRKGADICLQIGTGYFGCRNEAGEFDLGMLQDLIKEVPRVRMIEIKLSQGAKPGKGGVLPAAKITEEISKIRGIPMGKDCISPNSHKAFSDIDGMIDFIEGIAEATGLPVGIKSAIGQLEFFEVLADKMKDGKRGPDFITIDGGEGGTGAAPLTFADHVSLPYKVGFSRVFKIFDDAGIADKMVWVGSGKLGFPDRAIVALAMGADLIQIARESMLAIGCIQAQKCHTGFCPTGVATQNGYLQRGLHVPTNAARFKNYVSALRNDINAITHACGYIHPGQFTMRDIEISAGPNMFKTLEDVFGYNSKAFTPEEAEAMSETQPVA